MARPVQRPGGCQDLRRVAFEYLEGRAFRSGMAGNSPDGGAGLAIPRGFMKAVMNLVVLGSEMITKAGLIKVRSAEIRLLSSRDQCLG